MRRLSRAMTSTRMGGWGRIAGLAGCLFAAWCANAADETLTPDRVADVRYGFSVHNPGTDVISGLVVHVSAPMTGTAHQVCRRISASAPFTTVTDGMGHHILRFDFPPLAPFARQRVTIDARVELYARPRFLETGISGYLEAEPFIELDDPAVQAGAPRLTGDQSESNAVARLAGLLQQQFRLSSYDPVHRGAAWAFQRGGGDCTEYADALVATYRRHGMPARGVGGFMVDRSRFLPVMDYHNWCEVMEGDRWLGVDATREQAMIRPEHYVVFRYRGDSEVLGPGYRLYHHEGGRAEVVMDSEP